MYITDKKWAELEDAAVSIRNRYAVPIEFLNTCTRCDSIFEVSEGVNGECPECDNPYTWEMDDNLPWIVFRFDAGDEEASKSAWEDQQAHEKAEESWDL